MINFNGNTKRRNVNLGNSRRTLKPSKNNYLVQLNQERENRIRAKQELNAAVTLQSAIRRHQALMQEAITMKNQWNPQDGDPNAVLKEFSFFASILSSEIDEKLIVILNYYKSIDLTGVSAINVENVLTSLIRVYTRLLKGSNKEDLKSMNIIAQIAILSYKYILNVANVPIKELLSNLNDTIYKHCTEDNALLIDTLFLYSQADFSSLIQFLSLENSIKIIEPLSGDKMSKIKMLLDFIASSGFDEVDLSEEVMFQFLGNFVELVTSHHLFKPASQSLKALSNVLKAIHSEVAFIEDLDGDIIMSDDNSHILVADYTLSKKLEILYSRDIMSLLFSELEVSKSYEDFSQFLYSSLHMLNGHQMRETNASLKNKVLTNLLISTSCSTLVSHWFKDIIIKDVFAMLLIDESVSQRNIDLSESKIWWETLYLFEEVLSYTFMFQNDKAISKFGDPDMLPKFTSFLKNFCLYIALNGVSLKRQWANDTIGEHDFEYLCKLSFKLLNQLYLRNTRMHFVDDKVWSMEKSLANGLRFNTETVINLLKGKDDAAEGDEDESKSNGNRRTRAPTRYREETIGALNILIYMPFLIPFETRAQLFQSLIAADKRKIADSFGLFAFETQGRLQATISRENLLFDAFEALGNLSGSQFKKRLNVAFVNQFGPENGIDGGGLTKEFLTSVAKDGFQYVNFDDETLNSNSASHDYNFFKQTPDTYQIYPSTDFYWRAKFQAQQTKLHGGKLESRYDFTEENQLFSQMMRFLGMIVGKCLYENILLDVSFAPFFLSKWCSVENVEGGSPQYKNSFDDLKSLDEKLYNSLIKLLSLNDEELKELELFFSISEKLPHQSDIVTVDLIPGGSSIQVDQTNKLQYVYAVANFKLNTIINTQTKYFLSGLFEIIQPSWLNLFSHIELAMLVSGGEKPVDVEDLKANTAYGGYLETDETIKYFWEVVEEFSPEDRSKLLKFATSSSKAPLLGFKDLYPKFGIRDALDTNRLPTASTCVNLLKLPNYRNKKVLKEKLLYAINAESGFDLS